MTPEDLADAVRGALLDAIAAGEVTLPGGAAGVPERVHLERPRAGERGDWSTNLALRLARDAGLPPFELAGILARRLGGHPEVRGVGVAGPGFLNITLVGGAGGVARDVVTGDRLRRSHAFAGRRVEIATCVAAAPVLAPGGSASDPAASPAAGRLRRAGFVADALEAMLVAGGAQVTRTTTARPGRAAGHLLVTDGGVVDTIAVGPLRVEADAPAPGEPGEDALRLAALRTAPTVPVAAATAQLRHRGADNPAYVIGHAHARLATLLDGLPVQARSGAASAPPDPGLLVHATERELVAALHDVDRAVTFAVRRRDPSRLVRHLEAVAGRVDDWLVACPPRPAGDRAWREVHRSRLVLADGARRTLARGLGLLGASPPARL